jgi:hypothetical protein
MIRDVEDLTGGRGGDTLAGNEFSNNIEGGDGIDFVNGREGLVRSGTLPSPVSRALVVRSRPRNGQTSLYQTLIARGSSSTWKPAAASA